MYHKNPETLDTPTLLQHCANARTTWFGAGGHGKAEMNKQQYNELHAILKSRGVTDQQMEAVKGNFNGDGSL